MKKFFNNLLFKIRYKRYSKKIERTFKEYHEAFDKLYGNHKPNIDWSIIDQIKADAYNLKLLEVNDKHFLVISIKDIPNDVTVSDYIKFIQETGIVLKR